MEQLLGWLEEGRIRPPAIRSYAFEQVARAHRDLESGQTVGKLVLLCCDECRAREATLS
jgi:NADPH:quinone reductase-like Zn-dependent oxidoreductase